eukprot:CAMPEP_0197620290 /NCGR_PEP_ID=MMETSP1338-20131121/1142_1 /TAXON_ID=43686 ORGANISM="Pelagodinium beii, Strain RCC1491" /NCGR_SAMPLE_ID=MMETSP1338 /ASSEMBLY_ACC=CAM_ASM_000754 /LENGTH=414 /DNA_ID=CAMNT_0043189431 /DNA_START=64 /DNA_END=1308 /DNA_ORIENTATION=+
MSKVQESELSESPKSSTQTLTNTASTRSGTANQDSAAYSSEHAEDEPPSREISCLKMSSFVESGFGQGEENNDFQEQKASRKSRQSSVRKSIAFADAPDEVKEIEGSPQGRNKRSATMEWFDEAVSRSSRTSARRSGSSSVHLGGEPPGQSLWQTRLFGKQKAASSSSTVLSWFHNRVKSREQVEQDAGSEEGNRRSATAEWFDPDAKQAPVAPGKRQSAWGLQAVVPGGGSADGEPNTERDKPQFRSQGTLQRLFGVAKRKPQNKSETHTKGLSWMFGSKPAEDCGDEVECGEAGSRRSATGNWFDPDSVPDNADDVAQASNEKKKKQADRRSATADWCEESPNDPKKPNRRSAVADWCEEAPNDPKKPNRRSAVADWCEEAPNDPKKPNRRSAVADWCEDAPASENALAPER